MDDALPPFRAAAAATAAELEARRADAARRASARDELDELARIAMAERGLAAEFSPAALDELARIAAAPQPPAPGIDDLTALPWCSIDNDDSRDLDQLSVMEARPNGGWRVRVAIADVDVLVPRGSAIDAHASINTTSVYTSARIFPMLPERLSTDLTSLNPHVTRCAVVTTMDFDADARLHAAEVGRAWVHNHAKLAYDGVAAWLDDQGPLPAAAAAVPAMAEQLRWHDALAQKLRAARREAGALEFRTFQPRAVFVDGRVVEIREQPPNRARQLIEELMIATNGVTAAFLAEHRRPSIRRVVRSPERWARIVEVAAERGADLPPVPDASALSAFLAAERKRDPLRFPDLSLVVVKLMGAGEYVVEQPGGASVGHFGLAVRDYAHSTAPNRRYPDLITQRLIKAVLANAPSPYDVAQLQALAAHCTAQEDAANKVERQMRKSEAALLLRERLGQVFDGVVTGAANGNVWVRIFTPPAEGKLHARRAMRVGQVVKARLRSVDVERGHIDFELD